MTANTTLAAVSNASTTAEKRTRESFRIRCFPNLSTPDANRVSDGVGLDWSNWDAIRVSEGGNKLCVCLDLQNYKCLRPEKLLKLVFRCDFLYFQFLVGIQAQKPWGKFKNCGAFLEEPRIQKRQRR